ncbi:hypothetical protein KUTeg_022496 [Tegillarca granosa]|uniref:Uncharacterized protein n=1 Tax=Tegillarca granosa TaxID=220873 RepID=A0ABQ9EAQ8_TEGGR|nr:hypothetical protein KUTeg_022496 [Tegillarca granosa]
MYLCMISPLIYHCAKQSKCVRMGNILNQELLHLNTSLYHKIAKCEYLYILFFIIYKNKRFSTAETDKYIKHEFLN